MPRRQMILVYYIRPAAILQPGAGTQKAGSPACMAAACFGYSYVLRL